jgi:hypothetical protein
MGANRARGAGRTQADCSFYTGVSHGIRELWSADRDFSRFPRLKVTNPLIEPR